MAILSIPVLLVASRPFGNVEISLMVACSLECLVLTWVNWKLYSEATMTSIAIQNSLER
jgi:DNA-binding transcriptional regulator of glucitol operon